MPSGPFVSVIVCTRNRAASLATTLDSMVTAARHVADQWELLVVDNGSTDGTPDAIAAFADRLPIRRVAEDTPGLSNARNAGVKASQGEYIVWTDDDVLVDEQWLAAWFRAFRAHPDAALFGGRAVPRYEEPVQAWFKANEESLASLLAIRNQTEWQAVTPMRVPYGLNYAIRGQEQRAHHYDPELGVAPGRRRGGEEVAVIRAILAEGGIGLWVWDATVYHLIPLHRQSEDYIRQFYRANGYDFPIAQTRTGMVGRMKGVLRTLGVWGRAKANHQRKSHLDPAAGVAHLVMASKAEGSLRRYLGMAPF